MGAEEKPQKARALRLDVRWLVALVLGAGLGLAILQLLALGRHQEAGPGPQAEVSALRAGAGCGAEGAALLGETAELRRRLTLAEKSLQGTEESRSKLLEHHQKLEKVHDEVVRAHGKILKRSVLPDHGVLTNSSCRPSCGCNHTRLREVSRQPGAAQGAAGVGIIFLRIQKTGGSTFENVLSAECARLGVPAEWYWHLDWNLVSHFQLNPSLAGRAIITWLRDPLERVVSEYNYLKEVPAYVQPQWDYPPRIQSVLAFQKRLGRPEILDLSLSEFVSMRGNPANNRQTLYLLGFNRPEIFACKQNCGLEECDEDCGNAWDRYITHGGVEPGEALAQAVSGEDRIPAAELVYVAQSRLAYGVHVFGLVDCFDDSLRLMAHSLGWDPKKSAEIGSLRFRAGGQDGMMLPVPKGNETTHRSRLSAPEVAHIERANALDLALHKFAVGLLRERMRTSGLSPPPACGGEVRRW